MSNDPFNHHANAARRKAEADFNVKGGTLNVRRTCYVEAMHTATNPKETTMRKLVKDMDAGELREFIAEQYSRGHLRPASMDRLRWAMRRCCRLTGLSEETIICTAVADAAQL